MAKSLFLADGSMKLIFNENDRQYVLATLIREYLGTDCEELFISLLEDGKGGHDYLNTNDGDDYEQIADGYLAMLRDTLEELDAIITLLSEPRLNRKKLQNALRQCRNNIYNSL